MAISKGEKAGYTICLVLIILLVGLHIAVVVKGYQLVKDSYPTVSKEIKQEMSFVIIAASMTFFISFTLLIGLYSNFMNPKIKHILASLNLIFEFAIAVVISLRASNLSNIKYHGSYYYKIGNDFELYYNLSIADAVITFVLELALLFFIYMGTLNETITRVVVPPVITELPPLSNRQF